MMRQIAFGSFVVTSPPRGLRAWYPESDAEVLGPANAELRDYDTRLPALAERFLPLGRSLLGARAPSGGAEFGCLPIDVPARTGGNRSRLR
jgi:hypothetical protein